MQNQEKKYKITKTFVQEIFRAIDIDNNGCITIIEMIEFLESVSDDITEAQVREIFSGLDMTGDRRVDFEEFMVNI